ncbi:hypothetical protein SLA2020_064500 [Shorea laevis]
MTALQSVYQAKEQFGKLHPLNDPSIFSVIASATEAIWCCNTTAPRGATRNHVSHRHKHVRSLACYVVHPQDSIYSSSITGGPKRQSAASVEDEGP